jgi:hypothetical protein
VTKKPRSRAKILSEKAKERRIFEEFFAILPFAVITLLLPALPLQGYAFGALGAAIVALALVWFLRAPYQSQLQAALQNRPSLVSERELDPLMNGNARRIAG